jgi:hypothetical protein
MEAGNALDRPADHDATGRHYQTRQFLERLVSGEGSATAFRFHGEKVATLRRLTGPAGE